ncbi:MAG: hypothetical protein WAP03_21820 [Methylorubrum rhodinum]|uniref:hypothetical protein n=1 Tax=Methylorubrum rhodinum TaxID=29428 RepID=UPI003BAEDA8C
MSVVIEVAIAGRTAVSVRPLPTVSGALIGVSLTAHEWPLHLEKQDALRLLDEIREAVIEAMAPATPEARSVA